MVQEQDGVSVQGMHVGVQGAWQHGAWSTAEHEHARAEH